MGTAQVMYADVWERKAIPVDVDSTESHLVRMLERYADEISRGADYCGICFHESEDIDDCEICSESGEFIECFRMLDMHGTFAGVILVLGTGGPHIELNTREARLKGIWGSTCLYYDVDRSDMDRIEDVWSQLQSQF